MQCVDELQMLIVSCDKTQNIFCLKLPKVFVYYQNVTVNGLISVRNYLNFQCTLIVETRALVA